MAEAEGVPAASVETPAVVDTIASVAEAIVEAVPVGVVTSAVAEVGA